MTDLLTTTFQQCAWRGISFPIETIVTKGGQKLAVHNRMDRDGANVEGTGRKPFTFYIKGYFIKGLTPGINEDWSAAELFPNTWLSLRKSLIKDKSTGILSHPLYGDINCKLQDWSDTISSGMRDGVIADFEFMETIEEGEDPAIFLGSIDEISNATDAASNLDSRTLFLTRSKLSSGKTKAAINALNKNGNMITQVSAIFNSVALQTAGKVNSLINTIYTFRNAIQNEGDFLIDMFETCERLIDSLNKLSISFVNKRETSVYIVKFNTTLPSIAGYVGNSLLNILTLNPGLASYPIVSPGTKVLYYTL
jgi:prophage DNA circulation protein